MKSVMGFADAPSVIRSQVEALQGWCCLARSIDNSGKCLTRPSPWAAHTAPFSQAHHPEAAAATTAATTGSAERAPGQPWRDRQTGGQTDQAHCRGAATTSTTRAALASLPRPGRFPEPPPQRRRWEEGGGGGREGKRPPLPVWPLLSRPPVGEIWRQVFPRIGTPKLLSAHGILLWGDPPLAADLRGWDRISVATLSQHLSASFVQLYVYSSQLCL